MIDNSFITPIQMADHIGSTAKTTGTAGAAEEGGSLFSDIFSNAIKDVKDTQANLDEQQYLLATGQTDDTHKVTIASSEAQMAVDMLVQLRNKALDSYKELMNTNL